MNLCKDCKHAHQNWMDRLNSDLTWAYCHHPSTYESCGISPVTGDHIYVEKFCKHERRHSGQCGPEGKNFEPKGKR